MFFGAREPLDRSGKRVIHYRERDTLAWPSRRNRRDETTEAEIAESPSTAFVAAARLCLYLKVFKMTEYNQQSLQDRHGTPCIVGPLRAR
jgi:hypothetical protein